MRTGLETIAVAFSMFSAIPMPQFSWTEKNMRYAMCAFPLVGVVVGGLCWLWAAACQWLGLPELLRGVGLCLLPVAVTGGIHLDGYCDTADALASHGSPEKKQEIMKDPHIGAFGVIRLCGYLILSFALWATLADYPGPAVWLSFCLSRTLSGLAVATFPLAKGSGLAYTFATAADKKVVAGVLAAASLALAVGLCFCGWAGAAMAVLAVLVFLEYRHRAIKAFGGLSGDLAGWFLQRAELWMLAGLWAVTWMEGML